MQASENTSKPRLEDSMIPIKIEVLSLHQSMLQGVFVPAWCWTVGYRMVWSTILGFNTMLCSYLFGEDVNVFDLKIFTMLVDVFLNFNDLYARINTATAHFSSRTSVGGH